MVLALVMVLAQVMSPFRMSHDVGTKSKGPKGLQLKVGARMAPWPLVLSYHPWLHPHQKQEKRAASHDGWVRGWSSCGHRGWPQ